MFIIHLDPAVFKPENLNLDFFDMLQHSSQHRDQLQYAPPIQRTVRLNVLTIAKQGIQAC